MRRLSDIILRHRLVIIFGWLAVLVAGVLGAGPATERLDASFTLPGAPGYEANVAIERAFGNGGGSYPIVPVMRLPGDLTAASPAVRDGLQRASRSLERGGLRAADYRTPRDDQLVYAVVHKPAVPMAAEDARQRRKAAADAAAEAYREALPPGTVVRLTGLDLPDADSTGPEEGGPEESGSREWAPSPPSATRFRPGPPARGSAVAAPCSWTRSTRSTWLPRWAARLLVRSVPGFRSGRGFRTCAPRRSVRRRR